MSEALVVYQEGIGIYRELAKSNAAVYLPYVATTLNNLGVIHAQQGKFKQALNNINEAKTIYIDFSKKAPIRFKPDIEEIEQTIQWAKKLQSQHEQKN